MENKRKVILDTDIGDDIDDSFALLLLLESHEFDVLGVTTVFRNSYKRALMAKQLIAQLGYDIKVYPGIDDPLKVSVDDLIQPEIKAKEKLDENGKYLIPQWSESMRGYEVENQSAVDFIIEQIHKYPNEVTLITIGPMTNIASAMIKDPSIKNLIKEIRIMGGGLNIEYPEWNVFCDPDAAYIIYNSNVKRIVQVGCNVTLQTGLSKKDVSDLMNNKSKAIQLVTEAMMKWFKHYEFTTPVMHDPLTVASLIDETLLEKQVMKMDVDVKARGMTVINNNKATYIEVATSVNKDRFFSLFKKILKI